MTNERRRAQAVLGVEPGISPPELRRRYRALVRRWHPDQFASDPRSQVEAEARMREINQAYKVLSEEPPADDVPASATQPPPRPSPPPGARLSREQINRMVDAIGTEGPLDGFLAGFSSAVSKYHLAVVMLLVVYAVCNLMMSHPALVPIAAAVGIVLAVHRRPRAEE